MKDFKIKGFRPLSRLIGIYTNKAYDETYKALAFPAPLEVDR